ncbi:hypothetical protein TNCV_2960001 [Trichonephila clavipes]|nr:hypothetical protein TNCV_2960001 [Trichonephila clavipes]
MRRLQRSPHHWGGQSIRSTRLLSKTSSIPLILKYLPPAPPPRRAPSPHTTRIYYRFRPDERNLPFGAVVVDPSQQASDHNPILIASIQTPASIFRRNISADWELFRDLLSPLLLIQTNHGAHGGRR